MKKLNYDEVVKVINDINKMDLVMGLDESEVEKENSLIADNKKCFGVELEPSDSDRLANCLKEFLEECAAQDIPSKAYVFVEADISLAGISEAVPASWEQVELTFSIAPSPTDVIGYLAVVM
jgi:hypothetical protein